MLKELITLLLKKGYQNICAISGPKNESSSSERLRGYRDALTDAGVAVKEENVRFDDYSFASGAEQMKAFLKLKNHPTAVFAANNFMAYGAMQVMTQAGFSVPRDIAITTFDVFDNTGLIGDRFIYVEQPAFEIGYLASQMCVNQKLHKEITNYCKMTLRHTIHD